MKIYIVLLLAFFLISCDTTIRKKDAPQKELKDLKIEIDDKPLNIQVEKFNNLYEAQFCNFGSYQRIVEAYQDGENIYIYIFGGNAANAYFSKLIFDSTGFVTAINVSYGPLSLYGSFGSRFIGY